MKKLILLFALISTTLSSQVPGWILRGNSNATNSNTFLGTTSNNPIRFRTNNIERFTTDSTHGGIWNGIIYNTEPTYIGGTLLSKTKGDLLYAPISYTTAVQYATSPLSITTNTISMTAASAANSGYVTTGTQTFAGNKTNTGDQIWAGNMTYSPTVNNSLTGANARIPSHVTANLLFTNNSLTSIASANNGGVNAGHTIMITNETGATITIINSYTAAAAGEAILTGTGTNLNLTNHGICWLNYDGTNSSWNVMSGGLLSTFQPNLSVTAPITLTTNTLALTSTGTNSVVLSSGATITSPTLTGTAITSTVATTDSSQIIANTSYVKKVATYGMRTNTLYGVDYGIVPDGTTDNTAAFNTFMAACKAGNYKGALPNGNIRFASKPNDIDFAFDLGGVNLNSTVLVRDYNQTGDTIGFLNIVACSGVRIHDMAIESQTGRTGGTMISVVSTATFATSGIALENLWLSTFGSNTQTHTLYMDGSLKTGAPTGVRDVSLKNVDVFGANDYSAVIKSVVGMVWTGGGIFPAGGTAAASGGLQITGISSVKSQYVVVTINTTQGLSLGNCLDMILTIPIINTISAVSISNAGTCSFTRVIGYATGTVQTNWANSAILGPTDGTYTAGTALTLTSNAFGLDQTVINTNGWVDWSGSIAPVGWTTPTINHARYEVIGHTVILEFYITGTSSGTTVQLTLPFAAANNGGENQIDMLLGQDNTNTKQAVNGYTTANSTTYNINNGIFGGAWTASGTKSVAGKIIYQK